MRSKKNVSLIIALIILGICVSMSSGCIETSSKSSDVGSDIAGSSVVEHQYLFGLMESKYDVRIWVLGVDVVNMQGINESEWNEVRNSIIFNLNY